jgi:hypothetical protein
LAECYKKSQGGGPAGLAVCMYLIDFKPLEKTTILRLVVTCRLLTASEVLIIAPELGRWKP